jgi:hypothetical protein
VCVCVCVCVWCVWRDEETYVTDALKEVVDFEVVGDGVMWRVCQKISQQSAQSNVYS